MARPKLQPTPNQPVDDPCVYVVWAVAAIFFLFTFLGIIRLTRFRASNGS